MPRKGDLYSEEIDGNPMPLLVRFTKYELLSYVDVCSMYPSFFHLFGGGCWYQSPHLCSFLGIHHFMSSFCRLIFDLTHPLASGSSSFSTQQ